MEYNQKVRIHGNGLVEIRLYEKSVEVGKVSKPKKRKQAYEKQDNPFEGVLKMQKEADADGWAKEYERDAIERGSAPVANSARLADLLRRPQVTYADIAPFDPNRPELPAAVTDEVEIQIKYAGYLARQEKQVQEFKKEESRRLPDGIDYNSISGLRLEARQKLSDIRPMSIGQAGRISGVSPADIAVLLIWLEQQQ